MQKAFSALRESGPKKNIDKSLGVDLGLTPRYSFPMTALAINLSFETKALISFDWAAQRGIPLYRHGPSFF